MSGLSGNGRSGSLVRTPAAERVLQAASEMFYRDGIRAVGVDAIAARAGVTKKTLYERFGSKDRLVVEYLRDRDKRWREWLVAFVERRGGSAKESILSTFDASGEWMDRENPRGCGFVNAAVELPEEGHPARAVIMDQKLWLRDYLANLATEAGVANPGDLAERLLILHEGATVTNALGTATAPAQKAREVAAVLICDSRS